jgi:tetratricopeptide (TPR) repeat protein
LDDLEAAMKVKLDEADKIFGSGETKPEISNKNPCIWTTSNLDVLGEKFPKDYRVPLLRGLYIKFFTSFDEKYYQQAIQELQKATLFNPRSPYPPFFIGEVYMRSSLWTKAAWSSDEGKRQPWRKAILYYTKAIQLDSEFTLAYLERATAYSGLKEYSQAIPDYDKVLELDKDNTIAYADRGLANLAIGRYMAATVDLGDAIRHKGENSNSLSMSYEYRGDAFAKMGSYRDAIENYSQAIKYQLANMTFLISLKQFRGLYPEYDKVSDEDLIRKINLLFWPQYDHTTMKNVLTEKDSEWKISMINELYEKRADCYLKSGEYRRGVLDFERIYRGIPDFGQYVERWRSMGVRPGEDWFIDVKSTDFSGTPHLWAKFMNKDKSYTIQAFNFDCKSRRIDVASVASYNKNDELVGSSDTEGGWQRVIPQTRGEQMYLGMCGK